MKNKLHDAEYRFMIHVWENEPIKSTELSKICDEKLGWKKSTTFNMIRKLVDKGMIQNTSAVVSSLTKKEDVQKFESENIIEGTFGGSLPSFVTAYLGSKKISKKEALELKIIIEEASDE